MTKRIVDCMLALAGLVLVLPLLAAIAVLVKADSAGPVFFGHERVGRRFRPFRVYKVRTMAVSAPGSGAAITFGGTRDARVTRVGHVLRRTKLDELPQLWNVIKGDMSLVGPRPEVAYYVERFRADYETILEVRPGMTDFASLAYRDEAALLERAADPAVEYAQHILPEKIRLAKEYVRRSSMAVDAALLARTVMSVWGPFGGARSVASMVLVMMGTIGLTGWSVGTAPRRSRVARAAAPHASGARDCGHVRRIVVSPAGAPDGAGTLTDPVAFATALAGGAFVCPGDALWLRGGTYRGSFVSELAGTPGAPIEVRSYPGERAIVDGGIDAAAPTLTINGHDTWYRDFDVTNTSPRRDGERGIGLNVFGPRVRLINLVVHDTGNGIGLWTPARDAEIYGDIIYNVGWEEHGVGKGHAIYVQNETGTKRLVDNVLFNGYSFGIHAYTEQGHIDNLHIEGNVAFNAGLLSPSRDLKANILVGGWRVAAEPMLVDNFTYEATPAARGIELGYWAGCTAARVSGNYLAGGIPFRMRRCDDVSMSRNRFYGRVDDGTMRRFPDNAYVPDAAASVSEVFVRPNAYERGRATIVVFNWAHRASLAVDLSKARLEPGERFEIRDVQDYAGPPVVVSTYQAGAPTLVPLAGRAATPPIGGAPVAHTAPEFDVFVVQPLPMGLP
jgi:lipopolysaccharide/colanic/teichoic acid biosynthesis glycosyltransferase